jgi:CelD/BcsL family acetyltransferase involved in cellulose biosynthesis
MRIDVVSADRLSKELVAAWSGLQRADRAVDHPCFRPEFTEAVAAVRNDVEIAVMKDDQRPIGFLPFQRERCNIGRAVGSVLSDMHGAIAANGLRWDAENLVRQCGLVAWHFDHLVASQTPFQRHHECIEDSPYMDLSEGYQAYLAQRRSAGSSTITQAHRKARKLARECGPLRFEIHTKDVAAFKSLICWKREQVQRRNHLDFFKFQWTINLLERVQEMQSEAFSGLLSALYAGDHLIAVHLGMRSYDVISSWIPTYNPDFAKYSPGLLVHLELAKAAADAGVVRIDLGRGENRLKASLSSGSIPVAMGCVDLRPTTRLLRKGWYRARAFANSSPLANRPVAAYRRIRNWIM